MGIKILSTLDSEPRMFGNASRQINLSKVVKDTETPTHGRRRNKAAFDNVLISVAPDIRQRHCHICRCLDGQFLLLCLHVACVIILRSV